MNLPDMKVLNLQHYGKTAEEDLEVTLSPMSIKMVAAKNTIVQNREVKETTVLFLDGEPVTLNLNSIDLLSLQSVIGAYSFGFDEGN